MKILLLFPVLFYLLFILVNPELFTTFQNINVFGATTITIQFFLYNAIFVVLYALLVFFAYDGLNIFLKLKLEKQEKEIVELKSKLYDGQKSLLKNISKEIETGNKDIKKENKENLKTFIKESHKMLEDSNKENSKILVQHGKETDRILSKVNLLDKGLLDKIKDSVKI